MALVKFLTKQSSTVPLLADFFNSLQGVYGGVQSSEYVFTSTDYSIVNSNVNEWELHVEETIISLLQYLTCVGKNIIDIDFNVFPNLLIELNLSNNKLTTTNLDKLISYLANVNDFGTYIYNGTLITTGNTELRSSTSQLDVDTLKSRAWDIVEDVIIPTPTPTPTLTPTVTPTGGFVSCGSKIAQFFEGTKEYVIAADLTKTVQIHLHYDAYTAPDRFTLIQGSQYVTSGFVGSSNFDDKLVALGLPPVSGPGKGTLILDITSLEPVRVITESPVIGANSALEFTVECVAVPIVETIAGGGVPADFGGNVNSFKCNVDIGGITPTPTPTPTLYKGHRVLTIGGEGKRGDKTGHTCLVTPTPSQRVYAKIIAGCPVPVVNPTPTPSLTSYRKISRVKVLTIGGTFYAGSPGDKDGKELLSDPFPTPTPTPTSIDRIRDLSAIFDNLTPDPDITPSATATATVTPTLTPTSSVTPTPSVTPTFTPTPTCSVHCVAPRPKKEEPCCQEPAIVEGHGSTTFNSRVTSYVKLLNRCKSALGYPLIQLEITDEQIYNFIDISLEFFTKFGGYTEEYLVFKSTLYRRGIGLPIGDLFSITPELANKLDPSCSSYLNTSIGQDIDLDERRKVMDVFTVQPGDNSGINTLFTIEQTIAQQAYFGHLLGNVGFDLITFDVLKIWLKTRERVLALKPSYRFYPEKQLLRITPEPISTTPYYGIIGAYVQKPIRELISQLWIYKYTMAQIKVTMGHIRGKYAGTGLFGGQTVNYSDLMSQGIKEMDELEKELKTDLIDREPIPFFFG